MSENSKPIGRPHKNDNPTLRRAHLREQWRTNMKKLRDKKKSLGLKYYECISDYQTPAKTGPTQLKKDDENARTIEGV